MSDAPRKSSGKQSTQNIGVSIDGATIGGDVVVGNKIVTILGSRTEARERRDQLILLEKVKQFWIKGVLEKSVHAEALIELGKETQPEAVERPWDMVLEAPDKASQPIPPGKKVVELFDEMGRALLILGAPGSGKTITLLELARDLVARAESDPAQPIPVVFNLSGWSERRLPLANWLADELSAKYRVPRQVGRAWIAANDVLPLLDGLDEVRTELHAECVGSINRFADDHGLAGLVVCCRTEEYAAIGVELKAETALEVLPLTDEQVTDYFAAFGAKLAGLYRALQRDAALRELARTPLMLSVMALAYADVNLDQVLSGSPDSLEDRRRNLFETYVQKMLARHSRLEKTEFLSGQVIAWLAWLASQLQQRSRAVFLIEDLQPAWLPARRWRWIYVIVYSLMLGGVMGLAIGVFFASLERTLDSILLVIGFGLLSGLIAAAGLGILNGIRLERARASQPPTNSRLQQALGFGRDFLAAALITGAPVFLLVGLLALGGSILVSRELSVAAYSAFAAGLLNGLLTGSLFGLVYGARLAGRGAEDDCEPMETLKWSWPSAVRGVGLGLGGGVLVGVVVGLVFGVGAVILIKTGLFAELFAESITPDIVGAWYLAVVITSSCFFAMLCGAAGAMFGGLIGGLQGRRQARTAVPNQGIRQSWVNAGLAAALFWLSGCVPLSGWQALAAMGASLLQPGSVSQAIVRVLIGSLIGGFSIASVGFLLYGGLVVCQHYTLRAILANTRRLPWQLNRLLDYCADHILLRKVGGGYIFIHRLLLEYFASLGTDR